MVTVELSNQEQEILSNLLTCTISDLRQEIIHCENFNYKEMLRNEKENVLRILEKIQSIKPVSA